MSTDDQTKLKKFQSNVLKFPGTNNPKVEEQQKELARITLGVVGKMSDDNWNSHLITHKELLILSNHGEAIELTPIAASRLISVLATSLIRNSFMEDFL